jgi:hypothetical protein
MTTGPAAATIDSTSVRITGGANPQEVEAVLAALRSAAEVDGRSSRYEQWRQRRIAVQRNERLRQQPR